ncbi:MAG: hypothetical protein KIT09_24515 [Bryobacteraceae bacterium]|nr:hypothetical protein [Bryobacteraceae bacterium]
MLRALDARTEQFLNDLSQINRRLERAQRELGSGRRVHQVSDAPDEVATILQLRAELAQMSQAKLNLGRVKSEVDAAESALQSAVQVMEQVSTLATQGASPDMNAERRAMIAYQVDALLEQMVVLAGTAVEGRFIFSGDSDGQLPFVLDLTQPNPVSPYLGGAATRQVAHPSGTRFSVARDGQQIFDNPDPALNVFAVINELRAALRADSDAGIRAVLAKTKRVETHLNSQLAFYGNAQNQVAEATTFATKQELRLQSRLSDIEEADLTEAIVNLNQAKYQQEVALATQAKLPKTSLFDFLG